MAFLRKVRDPKNPYRDPSVAFRPVDGRAGLILADGATLSRVRKVVARSMRVRPPESQSSASSFLDFSGLSEAEAAEVGIKLTPLVGFRLPITTYPLVMSCSVREHEQMTLTTSWFPPGRLPVHLYSLDYQGEGWCLRVRPDQMKLLLDSLTTVPAVAKGSMTANDTLSLMVRRVVQGSERVFECTLDRTAIPTLARILSNVVKDDRPPTRAGVTSPEGIARMNLSMWTRQLDPSTRTLW